MNVRNTIVIPAGVLLGENPRLKRGENRVPPGAAHP